MTQSLIIDPNEVRVPAGRPVEVIRDVASRGVAELARRLRQER